VENRPVPYTDAMRRLGGALIMIMALAAGARAHVALPADFRDIVTGAELIVRGRITDVRAIPSADDGVESVATVAIETRLKGSVDGFVDVHVPGGDMGRYRYVMVGAPTLRRDEHALFFLTRRADGAWRLVGLTAGLYVVQADAATGRLVVNPPVVPVPDRTTASQPVVRGDVRRPAMAVQDFEALVRAVMAGTGSGASATGAAR
jgi:hypothetical protein